MSEWYEIKNKEDVEISKDGKSLEVLFNSNDWGNQYIIIPIEFITDVFGKCEPDCPYCDYENEFMGDEEYYKEDKHDGILF